MQVFRRWSISNTSSFFVRLHVRVCVRVKQATIVRYRDMKKDRMGYNMFIFVISDTVDVIHGVVDEPTCFSSFFRRCETTFAITGWPFFVLFARSLCSVLR